MDSDKLNIPGSPIHLFSRHSLHTGYPLALCQVIRRLRQTQSLPTQADSSTFASAVCNSLSRTSLVDCSFCSLMQQLFINAFCTKHGPSVLRIQNWVCYETSFQDAESRRRTYVHTQFITIRVERDKWIEETQQKCHERSDQRRATYGSTVT